MAKPELKAGDKIVFGRGKKNKALDDITIGKIYAISSNANDCSSFIDDAGDNNEVAVLYGKATKIVE